MNSVMNKYTLSVAFMGAFALFVFLTFSQTAPVAVTPGIVSTTSETQTLPTTSQPQQTTSTATANSVPSTPKPTQKPAVTTPTPVALPKGPFRDGTFTGDTVDHQYGPVQVKAVIRNGYIADVVFLQHPDHAPRSQELNGRAMPLLTAEAIKVQNEKVDIVSGATLTSYAFRDSLGSALAQAR